MSRIDKNDTYGLSTPLEFFTFDSEVWFRRADGHTAQLTPADTELVSRIAAFIETFYTKAYNALAKFYEASRPNKSYFLYRIVRRFVRCNFSALDDIPDIDADNRCHFEYVACPIRGECPLERVVCHPEFSHHLTPAEVKVCRLWYAGLTVDEIAVQLILSSNTIHNHIRNAYNRLNVHSKAEFVKIAPQILS